MKKLGWAIVAVVLSASLISFAADSKKSAAAVSVDRPNVVLILIDDLSYFCTGVYGGETFSRCDVTDTFKRTPLKTPRIDALAEQGVLCTYAYTYPLCEATRVALMSGMNNGRNFLQPKSLHHSQITFADVFKRAGYATGMYGKWKQTRGTKEIPAVSYISEFGWDDYTCFDVIGEGQRYVNPNLVTNGKVEDYKGRTDLDPETGRRWYGPDICNRRALQFIEKHKNEPFFLYYPMLLVHDEHRPTPDTLPRSEFDTMDENKKKYNHNEFYPDMVAYADKLIGKVVDKIDELGLREKTLIIVMGDNGSKEIFYVEMNDGTENGGGKGSPRYNGERVPFIVSMPKTVPTGIGKNIRHYDGIIDVTDVYPTLLAASGIEIPNADKIDGVAFWEQLTGKKSSAHRSMIYKWYNQNHKIDDLSMMVRYAQTPFMKYYSEHDKYPRGRFFNLKEDPLEVSGEKGKKYNWRFNFYSGKDLKSLSAEEKDQMVKLKHLTDANVYVKVTGLKILNAPKSMRIGESFDLKHSVLPANATINNVIWESSDPKIATVDKFGTVKAIATGDVVISLYSWDDARPLASGKTGGFKRNGISAKAEISIK